MQGELTLQGNPDIDVDRKKSIPIETTFLLIWAP